MLSAYPPEVGNYERIVIIIIYYEARNSKYDLAVCMLYGEDSRVSTGIYYWVPGTLPGTGTMERSYYIQRFGIQKVDHTSVQYCTEEGLP